MFFRTNLECSDSDLLTCELLNCPTKWIAGYLDRSRHNLINNKKRFVMLYIYSAVTMVNIMGVSGLKNQFILDEVMPRKLIPQIWWNELILRVITNY